jgi:hypothetical protein
VARVQNVPTPPAAISPAAIPTSATSPMAGKSSRSGGAGQGCIKDTTTVRVKIAEVEDENMLGGVCWMTEYTKSSILLIRD